MGAQQQPNNSPEPMDAEFFCRACGPRALSELAELGCNCTICLGCAHASIAAQLSAPAAAGTAAPAAVAEPILAAATAVGTEVLYRQRGGRLLRAVVAEIDRSVLPPQFGIRLLEGTAGQASSSPTVGLRYTEASRLFSPLPHAGDGGGAQLSLRWPDVACEWCNARVSAAAARQLCPLEAAALDERLTGEWQTAHGVISCPWEGCGALIECIPAPAATASTPTPGGSGRGGASPADERDRYRCALCKRTFCGACRAAPYHAGLSCVEHAAPRCTYCTAPVLAGSGGQRDSDVRQQQQQQDNPHLSVAQLRRRIAASGADCGWCLEREELDFVLGRTEQVCAAPECRGKLRAACTKRLPCGHPCCGVRGEAPCLPCVEEGCPLAQRQREAILRAAGAAAEAAAAAARGGGCLICLEPLPTGPCLQLSCASRHAVHAACARARLDAGSPGPGLSFGFLFCPACGPRSGGCGGGLPGVQLQAALAPAHFDHPLLSAALAPHLEMRTAVAALARRRIKAGGFASAPELQVGGSHDGRPVDWALERFLFFQCARCSKPYFGGERGCGAAAPLDDAGAAAPAAGGGGEGAGGELLCGGCLAASAAAAGGVCKTHGTEYIEWKCQYCCNTASWFCWGTTHMCSRCHDGPPAARRGRVCSPATCTLKVPHPPPGGGGPCCLGCGLCRAGAGGQ